MFLSRSLIQHGFFFCLAIMVAVQSSVAQDIQYYKDQLASPDITDSMKIDAYKKLWRHYINSELDSANYYADEGLMLAERMQFPRGIADLSVYVAFGLMNKGFTDEALGLLKDKLTYLQTHHHFINGELYIIEWIANIHKENNQLDSATQYYQTMLDRSPGTHYHNLIGVHSGLGQLYQQQQYFKSAMYHFQLADSICQVHEVDNNVCTGCRSNTAQMLIEIGDFDKAQEYIDLAKLEYARREEYYLINELKLFEADLKMIRDEFEEALILANEAVDFFAKDSSILMWVKALNRAYQACSVQENLTDAEQIAEQLLSLNHILNDSLRLADAYSKNAFILGQRGKHQESLDNLNMAASYLADDDDLNIRMNITKNYVMIYDELGDHEQALKAQTEWAILRSELYARSNARMIKEMEIAYDIQNKEREIALLMTQNQLIAQQQKNQRSLMFGGIGLFLILSGFLYFLYRNKRQVNQRLREIDQIKTQLFANISHELRTPLTLIQGPIKRLLKHHTLDQEFMDQLLLVSRNTDRLKRLINNVSNLSRMEEGELNLNIKSGFLGHHIKQIANSFQYLATSKSIHFEITNHIPPKAYCYDPEYLETILYNLLSNAFKYTEEGSVSISAREDQGILHVEVSDTGKGIPEEEQRKIFKRYQRGSTAGFRTKGIGLGLALSSELASRHFGAIELQQSHSSGSTFICTIPVTRSFYEQKGYSIENQSIPKTENYAHANELTLTQSAEIHPDDPLILLVEDNPDMQLYIQHVFQNDYRIITAKNGQEGWDLSLQYIPDLILSDLMMPVLDGNGLLNKVREDERTSHIPFIMLTANHMEASKLNSLQFGADDYMTKPFSEDELLLKVQNQIATRKVLMEKYQKQESDSFEISVISPVKADQEFWLRLEQVVESNLSNVHFTADEFAKSMLMSRMQLHRKLKALTNLSASAFIRTQRLKEAAKMMRETSMTVSEVAYAVGFSSPFYFSKCFKEMYNQVPTKYAG